MCTLASVSRQAELIASLPTSHKGSALPPPPPPPPPAPHGAHPVPIPILLPHRHSTLEMEHFQWANPRLHETPYLLAAGTPGNDPDDNLRRSHLASDAASFTRALSLEGARLSSPNALNLAAKVDSAYTLLYSPQVFSCEKHGVVLHCRQYYQSNTACFL